MGPLPPVAGGEVWAHGRKPEANEKRNTRPMRHPSGCTGNGHASTHPHLERKNAGKSRRCGLERDGGSRAQEEPRSDVHVVLDLPPRARDRCVVDPRCPGSKVAQGRAWWHATCGNRRGVCCWEGPGETMNASPTPLSGALDP
eukprot:scaffold798_cov367-Pavlova_lutheri.AAC.14